MRRIALNWSVTPDRFAAGSDFSGAMWWLLTFALATAHLSARAHGDLHQRIVALDAQIQAQPGKADLYLARAELHSTHGDWELALADCDQTARLDAAVFGAELLRGQVLLAMGKCEPAVASLNRYLEKRSDDPRALVARARALARLGQRARAVKDYSRAIDQTASAPPEYYLERGQALVDGGDSEAAVKAVDEGIDKLGPLVVLQLFTIDLRLREKHYDDALARLEKIIAASPRKETWLARRGEILMQAGRRREAREAYASALNALNSLPPGRRGSRAMQELQKSVRTALDQLTPNESGESRP